MALSDAKKVVLVSRSGYEPARDPLLRSLLERKIELFCAVGRDCREWEDAMDALVVGPNGEGCWHVTTTSHPDESIDEVIEFAETWQLDTPSVVEVVEV